MRRRPYWANFLRTRFGFPLTCVRAHLPGHPAGRRPSLLPPSSLQPFGVVTAANGNIMHHSRDSCLTRRVASRCGGGGTNSIDNAGWSAKSLVGIPCSFSLSLPRTTVLLFLLLPSTMSENHAFRVSGQSAHLTAVGYSISINSSPVDHIIDGTSVSRPEDARTPMCCHLHALSSL